MCIELIIRLTNETKKKKDPKQGPDEIQIMRTWHSSLCSSKNDYGKGIVFKNLKQ